MAPSPWRVAMASSIGQSHVAAAQPCQDAHFHLEVTDADGGPVMVLAASDGAGSASMAEVGASLACETFGRLVQAYIAQGGKVSAIERPLVERWLAGIIYRLDMHAKQSGASLADYACTMLATVIGERSAAFLQIGDGAMVIWTRNGWRHVFWPQHGEFANTTNFLTSEGAIGKLEYLRLDGTVQEIALFTDGIENLVLQKAAKAAHGPFFDSMFPPLRQSQAVGIDKDLSSALETYLSSPTINNRTDDDKTLILASRRPA